MEFKNSFQVPLSAEQTWAILLDVERIAPCLPGARLVETVDERTFKGEMSLRLGPMSFVFRGTAEIEKQDEQAHTAVVKAYGSDHKGRGRAQAVARFALEPCGSETRVNVDTTLQLAGALAQFGRSTGVIEDVATHLFDEFERRLTSKLSSEPHAERGVPDHNQAIKVTGLVGRAIRGISGRLRAGLRGRRS